MCNVSHIAKELGLSYREAGAYERLTTRIFSAHHPFRIVALADHTGCIVCIPDGTPLNITLPSKVAGRLGVRGTFEAKFSSVSPRGEHRDGLALRDGRWFSLQSLGAGVDAVSVSFPLSPTRHLTPETIYV